MSRDEGRYVPAAGRAAFTRLYDPVMALTMRERLFRSCLIEQLSVTLPANGTVVDVGCGTGTSMIQLAVYRPDARLIGIDGDPEVLAAAKAKPGAAMVVWRTGLAGNLPLDDAGADAVVLSLLLHHLAPDSKARTLTDAKRVLRPGGRLHVVDWGRPHDPFMRGAFFALRCLDGFENTRDHAAGRLPELIGAAGFVDVLTYGRLRTAWGNLELLTAHST